MPGEVVPVVTTPPVGYYDYPTPLVDHVDRQDNTLSRNQHPKDHDDLERAVNALIYVLGENPQGGDGSVTARLLILQALVGQVQAQVTALSGAGLEAAVSAYISTLNLANLSLNHYVHYQRTTADTWTVIHNLGYDPVVAVVRDSPDQVILGFDLSYSVDHNSLTLGFSEAITGRAILSN